MARLGKIFINEILEKTIIKIELKMALHLYYLILN